MVQLYRVCLAGGSDKGLESGVQRCRPGCSYQPGKASWVQPNLRQVNQERGEISIHDELAGSRSDLDHESPLANTLLTVHLVSTYLVFFI